MAVGFSWINQGSGPTRQYQCDYTVTRTSNTQISLALTVSGRLSTSSSTFGTGLPIYYYVSTDGGSTYSSQYTLKSSTASWSGTTVHSVNKTVTVSSTSTAAKSIKVKFKSGTAADVVGSFSVTPPALLPTECTAPTTVTASPTSMSLGSSVTISWSGAKGGTSNAITQYTVSWQKGSPPASASTADGYARVATTATSGSYTHTPDSAGVWYYTVRTDGAAGYTYSSDYSAAKSTTVSDTPPSLTSITCSPWNFGSSGGSFVINTTPNDSTQSYYYSTSSTGTKTLFTPGVTTFYAGSNNTYSSITTHYYVWAYRGGTYSAYKSDYIVVAGLTPPTTSCIAPSSISVSPTEVKPGEAVTVTWAGASGGTSNSINGYTVYMRADAAPTTSTYTSYNSVPTTATSGSSNFTIPTSATNDSKYYFAVRTTGTAGSGYYSGISSSVFTLVKAFAINAMTKISGTWRKITKAYIKIDGSWREANNMKNKVSGIWK